MTTLTAISDTRMTPREPGYDLEVGPEIAEGRTIYVARHPELPGVFAQGDSLEESIADLAEVLDSYLTDMRASGVHVPPTKLFPSSKILGVAGQPEPEVAANFEIDWKLERLEG